jgi:hypothetical protein
MTYTDTSSTEYQNNFPNVCRLCGGTLKFKFKSLILKKYNVNYYNCYYCESIQVEPPFWLDEAYHGGNLTNFDFGILQRNLDNFVYIYLISKLLNIKKIVDFGGGDGLLCRLLRDYNINAFVCDKYSNGKFSPFHIKKDLSVTSIKDADLITGFEVIEHFINPADEFVSLFSNRPSFVLLSTQIYEKQDNNWWYYSFDSGQHLHFYTSKSINIIAEKHNYHACKFNEYILFSRSKLNILLRMMLKITSYSVIRKLFRILFVILPAIGVVHDNSARH